MQRKAQLFLIEVIISVSIMVILISALFSTQTITPPADDVNDLPAKAEAIIIALKENGLLYNYIDAAKTAFLGGSELASTNSTEIEIIHAFTAGLPLTSQFTLRLYRNSGASYQLIDIANKVPIPGGANVANYEHYIPGYNSPTYGPLFEEYRFQVLLWYNIAG